MEPLSKEKRRKIGTIGLAEKYGVSPQYVTMILKGERQAKSEKAKAILEHANKLISILEG